MISRTQTARAFTLLEVSLSTVVVAVLLVAAINTVGSARVMSASAADRALASTLAQDLMAEITARPVDLERLVVDLGLVQIDLGESDGDSGGLLAGLLGGVTGALGDVLAAVVPTDRSTFAETDDFDGWTESPPADEDGALIPGVDADWQRSVTVTPVLASTMTDVAEASADARRITVTVSRRGAVLAELTTVRTEAGDTLWFDD